jgi:hypothetical protein
MPWVAWSVPHHIGLPRGTRPVAWLRPVGSPHLYSSACEWLARPALHCNRPSACLAGLNGSDARALEPRERALEPSKHALGTRGCTFLYSCVLRLIEDCETRGGTGVPSHGEGGFGDIGR